MVSYLIDSMKMMPVVRPAKIQEATASLFNSLGREVFDLGRTQLEEGSFHFRNLTLPRNLSAGDYLIMV